MSQRHQVVYTLVTKAGGVDGLDHTDKGGKVVGVFGFEAVAKQAPNAPWCDVVPQAVDLTELAKQALKKLDPLEQYALLRRSFEAKGGSL